MNGRSEGNIALFWLDGQVALVTGAGAGIGRSIATCLSDAGAAVVVVDRELAALEQTVAAIAAYGGRVLPFAGDVGDHEQVCSVLLPIRPRH